MFNFFIGLGQKVLLRKYWYYLNIIIVKLITILLCENCEIYFYLKRKV